MQAEPLGAQDLFEGRRRYEIPPFQRPYVWNEEDQWAPLWDDIVRVTESHIVEANAPIETHFLGAAVFEEKKPDGSGRPRRIDVIDGQQRMTTLQVLLDAVHEVVHERGHADEAESLEELILNKASALRGTDDRFKLWPSQADRHAFAFAMDPDGYHGTVAPVDHRIVAAHDFFREEARRWLTGEPDEDGQVPPGDEQDRVRELSATLRTRLIVVAIDLTGSEDAQLIFETLNDRGTPLLKADLIKNWVFREGEKLDANIEAWSLKYWDDFDTEWWRTEIPQGRLVRSRVDIFLQYWLTMRLQDEVKAELVFRAFADHAKNHMTDKESAEAFLTELRNDADTYRGLGDLDSESEAGRFRTRVIEAMELAATTPVFLWLLSKNHHVPDDQVREALNAIESWVIRRTLLRKTAKDVNRLMVAMLKAIADVEPSESGIGIKQFLSDQTAEARYWPKDAEMLKEVPQQRMYGNIRQGRIRIILEAVERHLRGQSAKYESISLPIGMEIEHVMPRGWREFWDEDPKLSTEAAADRDWTINTLGNLTLVTKSLNGSLSNRPWTDDSASTLEAGGEPGKGKRSLLNAFSLLVLNKEIVDEHQAEWTEEDIRARSLHIAAAINEVWAGPWVAAPESPDKTAEG